MDRETEYERLCSDVLELDEGRLRDSTLQNGLRAMRRKRMRHQAARLAGMAVMALACTLAALWTRQSHQPLSPPHGPQAAVAPVRTIAGTDIRVLSDDELLALFEGQPVALVGPPGEQQLLLFEPPQN